MWIGEIFLINAIFSETSRDLFYAPFTNMEAQEDPSTDLSLVSLEILSTLVESLKFLL